MSKYLKKVCYFPCPWVEEFSTIKIICILFLFIIREPTPAIVGSARTNAKKEKRRNEQGSEKMEEKKRIKAQRENSRISILPVLELIGDAEQTGRKEKREQRKKQKAGLQLPWALRSHPTTRRDHTVSQFFLGIF